MEVTQRNRRRVVGVGLLAAVVSALACEKQPATGTVSPEMRIERGKYLVAITACNDCHTPFKLGPKGPAPDMSRMLSGHPQGVEMPPPPALKDWPWIWAGAGTNTAFAGPWGISYAINLTPDSTTGMGNWTEEMFTQAMRTGKHMGMARPILPPMPWQAYANLTDDDMRAMYAYLRSIPPLRNRVPEAIIVEPTAQPSGR